MSDFRPPSSVFSAPSSFTVEVDRITEPEWNDLLSQFADASIYQTWAYGAVTWGEKQLSHLVLREGAEPVALAQLRIVRLPVIRRGIAYLRWGPVCVRRDRQWDAAVFEAASRALIEEYVRRRRLLLRLLPRQFAEDPGTQAIDETWRKVGLRRETAERVFRTIRLDLNPSLETLRKQLDQKWRNQLNGAERKGLTIVEGTRDDLYGQFLGLYNEMMARKQFDTTVNPADFRRIQQRLPDPQKMLVLISQKDGRAMTGVVGTAMGETGIYLLGATSEEGMKTKGSYLLQWALIQGLKERGCRWYDLGGINPKTNPGVYHFKQGLGGQEVSELGRFALSADALSAASVKGAEHLRSLVARFRGRLLAGRGI